jgi:hypothetical protein
MMISYPGFDPHQPPSYPQPKHADTTPTQISHAAGNQRSIHGTYINPDILLYLQPSREQSLGLSIPASLSREERGLGSHITARFLIPRQHLDMFERDPDRFVVAHHQAHGSHYPAQRHQ